MNNFVFHLYFEKFLGGHGPPRPTHWLRHCSKPLKHMSLFAFVSLNNQRQIIFICFLNLDDTSSFGDEFLDTPMTAREKVRAAQRIQAKWRIVAKILEPEPFKHYEIHAFGEKGNDSERAIEMLEAWESKFGNRAIRRHFINAVNDPDVGYSNEVPEIFSGKFLVVLRAC